MKSLGKKVENIEKKTFLLIVLCASFVTWILFFAISSLTSIFLFDHTFIGWLFRIDDITHNYSFTVWSWTLLALGVFATIVGMVTSVYYYIDLRQRILASKHEIAKILAEKRKREENFEHTSVTNILSRISDVQDNRQTKLQQMREKLPEHGFN